jgi:transcriptional regulator GlxA family with amidase domain
MRIVILFLNGAFDTGLSAFLDAFQAASQLAGLLDSAQPAFDVVLAGVRDEVGSGQGMQVPVTPAATCGMPDLVLVPAPGDKMPGPLAHRLASAEQAIEKIAGQVGYRDGVTLRTLLRKRLGKGIRELRGYRGAEG